MRFTHLLPLALPCAVLAGCGGDAIVSGPDAGVDAAAPADAAPHTDAAAPTLEWAPCPLAGMPDEHTECTTLQVPLDRDLPEGRRIELFVKRIRAAEPDGRSLFVLMGGPGQAGADFETLAQAIRTREPGIDIILPDHRGTGRSTRLLCDEAESATSVGGINIVPDEWPGCRAAMIDAWGTEGLSAFSTTEAARDLVDLVDRIGTERTFVLGISYGTYLASRYLEVAPEGQVEGVVLDSVCPPGQCWLSRQDLDENDVAEDVLALCDADPDCAARFPDGAWAAFTATREAVLRGECALSSDPQIDIELFRTAAGILMMSNVGRRMVPALVHRMRRCNEADRAAFTRLYMQLFGLDVGSIAFMPEPPPLRPDLALEVGAPLGGPGASGYSFPLAVNILVGELWEPESPDFETLLRRWDGTNSCRGVSRNAAFQTEGWPRYTESLGRGFPRTETPVLALHAELDPAIPLDVARQVTSAFGPRQRFVAIPRSAHTVIAQGALRSRPTSTCGRELMFAFLASPTAELDTSCLDDTELFSFAVPASTSTSLLGTANLYGDE